MFFSRKNNASSGQAEANSVPEGNKISAETNDIQSAVNMQIQDMKELSKATAAVIDKVKAMKIDEVNRQLQSIDSRLKNLEGRIGEQDKTLAVLKSMPAQKQSHGDAEILEKAKAAACAASAVQLSLIDKRLNGLEEKIASMEKRLVSDELILQKHNPTIESIDASAANPLVAENAKKLATLEAHLSRIDTALSEHATNHKKSYQLIESMEQTLAEKLRKTSSEEIGKRFEAVDSRLKSIESRAGSINNSTIEKPKVSVSEGMIKHLDGIDPRPKFPESNMISRDKNISSAQNAIKMGVPTIQKPAASLPPNPLKVPEMKPLNQVQKSTYNALEPSRPKDSHIIETTMDREKKDSVKEAINSYEMRTITNRENTYLSQDNKQNILSSIVNQIMPAAKKELPIPQKETHDSTRMHDAALDAIGSKAATMKGLPYQGLKDISPMKPANISKPGDASDPAAKLSADIARAKQMVREKKYSEATEIYLMLINALEDSKSDRSVKGLAPAIDELYEYISSNLLTNLSAPEEKEITTAHRQNKPI